MAQQVGPIAMFYFSSHEQFKNIWGGGKEVSLKQRGMCIGAAVPLSKRTQDFEMGFEDGLVPTVLCLSIRERWLWSQMWKFRRSF